MAAWQAVPAAGTAARFRQVRQQTLALCAGLSAEDLQLQSMPDASPGKWHLAHTSWFFEQFVLGRDPAYRPRDPAWHYLFNSYYQSVGPMHARPQRGLLSRPSLDEVRDYRRYIDDAVSELLGREHDAELPALVELGLQHEQQHQELLLTDIKHAFWCNPLRPAYRAPIPVPAATKSVPLRFVDGTRRHRRDRPSWRRLRLRQRDAPPSCAAAAACAGQPAGDQCRIPGLRARGRLSRTGSVAVRRLGHACSAKTGSTRSTGRTICPASSPWRACARSIRTSRCVTSAISRPMRLRAGPARGCRPRRMGVGGAGLGDRRQPAGPAAFPAARGER